MNEMNNQGRLKRHSIRNRKSKVRVKDFSRPMASDDSIQTFWERIPNILAGKTIRSVINSVIRAKEKGRGIIWAIGAHVIKCGLNPILIDLMENKMITGLAMNGAGFIHDFEIAFFGETSEDVEMGLEKGAFGMAQETGEMLNQAINEGVRAGLGAGEAVGRWIETKKPDFIQYSILAKAIQMEIPVTAHIAIGTDIVHMHPGANGAFLGEGSLRDFHHFLKMVRTLHDGGVYFNIGSAVILPEVFLKAITMAINLGYPLRDFTTVNMDFIQHYRPIQNVVKRPVMGRGRGYTLIGHHEILIPLIAAGIKGDTLVTDEDAAG